MRWFCILATLSTVAFASLAADATRAAKPTASKARNKTAQTHASSSTAKKRSSRRVARKPAGPSYQLHPDPARYAEIQHALADRGYFHGEPNGEWKDDSVDALKRFQADQKLPDDGKISALTLTGLGLGPHHDGSTAATVPLPTAPATEPPVAGSAVGPASSTTPKKDPPAAPGSSPS